jgi:hypothetical protein
MEQAERRLALDRFYEQLQFLEKSLGGKRVLSECDGRMDWPRRGVYFFFEDGEFREDGVTLRVVRVGTRALRPSKSTLWGRLSQHRGSVGGSRPGGGNHRGSIFRLHVGTALLASGEWPEEAEGTWGIGSTAKGKVRGDELGVEVAVSRHIGAMPFLWVAVDDEPGNGSDRGIIEAGAIALLSNTGRPVVDLSSISWLGQLARREVIRTSGLWNVEHVQSPPTIGFLDVLSGHVESVAGV